MKSIIHHSSAPTQAERAAGVTRLARLRDAVRGERCRQCGTRAHLPCRVTPPADCLARWLAAYACDRITREELIGAISGLVVISAAQQVAEQSAS